MIATRRLMLAVAALAAVPAAPSLASGGEKAAAPVSSYVQLPGVTATIVRRDGRHGVLSVDTGVDVPDGKLRAQAAGSIPRLRDAYAQVLQAYAAGLPPGRPPQVDYLAGELQRATDRVLGRPGARLLIGTVMVN